MSKFAFKKYRDSKRVQTPSKDGEQTVAWAEEYWYTAHQLGHGPVLDCTKAGAKVYNERVYDMRVLPEDARETLAAIDAEIRGLQERRQLWLDEHFREWPVMNAGNAPRIIGGRAKASAQAEFAKMKKPDAQTLKNQRRMVDELNRAIRI